MDIIHHALDWLASEQGLQALLMRNWLLGLVLVALIIYTESVAFFLPFLPGDSLLVTTGVFITAAGISPALALAIIGLGALLADATNYAIGRSRLGHYITQKHWIKDSHLTRLKHYFRRFGGVTIVFARFIPILRTAAPFLAGITHLKAAKCAWYSLLGVSIWVGGLLMVGVAIGHIEVVKRYIILWPLLLTIAGLGLFILYAIKRRCALGRWV